jgi:glycosyltransferase involved in cell wall biosynthesis
MAAPDPNDLAMLAWSGDDPELWFYGDRPLRADILRLRPPGAAVRVTVLIPAHNEEKVISNILSALMTVKYPEGRMLVIPINDRSTDGTRAIIDDFVEQFPGRIQPFHRAGGKGGKAAALRDAMELVTTEVILIFDADYIPGAGLIKQLVAPFFDPEVGGVMGRVVPLNVGTNLLTRLLDLGAPHYLIQSTLTGVVAQRLIRTLCPHCKVETALDVRAWDSLVHRWRLPPPPHAYGPKGCLECRNTGFLGRTGIYEMMRISPNVRAMILPNMDLQKLSETALAEGLRPLRVSAAAQVARGVTTIAEVVGVLPPVE